MLKQNPCGDPRGWDRRTNGELAQGGTRRFIHSDSGAGHQRADVVWAGESDFLTVPKFHRDEAHQLTVGTVA